MNKEEIVSQIESKFCKLSAESKAAWNEKSIIIKLKKSEVLVEQGKRSDKIWFIGKGIVRAYYLKDGKRICDWFAFENEFISAITSFYSDTPSLHQIDIISDAVLLETSRETIAELCDQFHDFERLGRLSTTETMLRLQQRIVSLQFETASQKLHNLLQQYPNIYQLLPLGDIASYLGITQETLSRLRSKASTI